MLPQIKKTLRKPFSFVLRNTIGTIVSVSTDKPIAALTFDDGPNPEFTPQLLDVLDKYNAKATFFMVGKAARNCPKLVKKIANNGHAIGNHSWNHPSLPLLRASQRKKQILACQRAIAPYGQKLFRPPYGHQSLASHVDAFQLGYKVVGWDIAAEDWLGNNVEFMVEKTATKIRPGSIILFHDRLHTFWDKKFADRQPMLKTIDTILEQFRNKFDFVTVPELLKHGKAKRQNWYCQENADWLKGLKKERSQ